MPEVRRARHAAWLRNVRRYATLLGRPAIRRAADVIEIGGGGIDVVAAGGALWVPSRSPEVDRTGLPTMESLRRVTPDGRATTVATPSGRLDVHGLAASDRDLWLADNTGGIVYRIVL